MKITIVRTFVIGALLAAGSAQAQSWETYRPRQSMLMFNYEMSKAVGSFADDFITDTSWNGFSFEQRSMLNERFSAGVSFTYNRFEQTYSNLLLQLDGGGAFSGPVYRYADQLAVKGLVHAYFLDGPFRPYVGAGLGGVWAYSYGQTADFARTDDGFDFIVSPEVGLTFTAARGASSIGLNVAYRYNWTSSDFNGVTDAQSMALVVGLFGAY